MKTLLTATTAGFLALAGAASAMTANSATLQAEVNAYVQGVDLSTLTDAQIGAIKTVIHSGDSASEVRSFIQSVANG